MRMHPDEGADANERLSADDMATRREGEFLQRALLAQQARASSVSARPGVCTNCGAACLPRAVYCDDDCRVDHAAREQRMARQGRGPGG